MYTGREVYVDARSEGAPLIPPRCKELLSGFGSPAHLIIADGSAQAGSLAYQRMDAPISPTRL